MIISNFKSHIAKPFQRRRRERAFVSLFGGCGAQPGCYAFRGIVGGCTGGNDGVNANMLAYLNAYDLTTVPWGVLRSVTFSSPSLTEPDNLPEGMPVDSSNPGPDGVSQWFTVEGDGTTPFPNATGQRCQVWWPAGSSYGVWAVDSWNALQTAWICCTGRTTACGGNIIEIPIPNSSLPSPIPWNRIHYIARLGVTASTIDANYVAGLAFGVAANYGSAMTSTPSSPWNVNQVCYPSPYTAPTDPFDGGAP